MPHHSMDQWCILPSKLQTLCCNLSSSLAKMHYWSADPQMKTHSDTHHTPQVRHLVSLSISPASNPPNTCITTHDAHMYGGGDSSAGSCLTETPGAILTPVQVPGAGVARDFSPRVNFQCRLSYSVCTAPVCNCMHQHLCACSKSQTLAAVPLFGYIKIPHIMIVGSATLVAVVP